MKVVRPYTAKGKIICGILAALLSIVSLFKGKKWKYPREFEENPRTMSWKDLIYFSYKYYYQSATQYSNEVIAYFQNKKETIKSEHTLKSQLTISIGGDLMPYELINMDSCVNLWDEIGPDFFGSDIVFANLETPIDIHQAKGFVPEVMLNNMYFNGDEVLFNIFNGNGQYKGYDVLSFANNHTLDKGKDGLLNTLKFLENKSILPVGVASSEGQKTYQIIEKNGIKVAFLAYTYSLNAIELKPEQAYMVNLLPLNLPDCPLDQVKSEVIAAKEEGAELVIISVHAGNAYQAFPSQVTVNLYERLFNECGVDIIAGGHPHNLQPWKYYHYKDPFTQKEKKGFAIFSLADFVAYDIYTWCHLCAYLTIKVMKLEDSSIDFSVKVHPTVMERVNNKFKLTRADRVFSKKQLSDEELDLKELYDRVLGVYS